MSHKLSGGTVAYPSESWVSCWIKSLLYRTDRHGRTDGQDT